MRIAIAAGHAAVRAAGAEAVVVDLPGAGPEDDYPDVAGLAAAGLADAAAIRGILLCATEQGWPSPPANTPWCERLRP